jgi:hypothetical protein
MNTVLFFTKGLAPFHLVSELNFIEKFKSQGWKVVVATCNKALKCQWNPTGDWKRCAMCSGRTDHFLKGVTVEPFEKHEWIGEIKDMEDLKSESWGAASSTISIIRDTELTTDEHYRIAYEQMNTAYTTRKNMECLIEKHSPDLVVIDNGRFAESRPIVELCKEQGIDFLTIEKKGVGLQNERWTFRNTTVYDVEERQRKMLTHSGADTGWYQKRRYRKGDFIKFNPDSEKRAYIDREAISVFITSEDEMSAVPEWNMPDQAKIIRELAGKTDRMVYVRMHPNLAGLNNTQVRDTLALDDLDNVIVFRPEEKIDSYDLADRTKAALVFGSTIGIEISYWGKTPVFLLGESFYKGLGVVYEIETIDDLLAQIDAPPIERNPYHHKFANYMQYSGEKIDGLSYKGKDRTYWKGKKIKKLYKETLKYLWSYLPL